MRPARCPTCGTERYAKYKKLDGKCIAIQCVPCGTIVPCCPQCGASKVGRDKTLLKCLADCQKFTFPDPKIKQPEKQERTPEDINFLVRVGQELSAKDSFRRKKGKTFVSLRSPQRFEEEQKEDSWELGRRLSYSWLGF